MNKYYFIQFGNEVLYNDRLMRVYCPIKEMIKDDTPIHIIPVGQSEDCNEEFDEFGEPSDCYATAVELSPVLSEFNKGYWCAVQDALMNGAGETVVRNMLQGAGFSFWECQYHMKDSETLFEELQDIVNDMFCQKPATIGWNGADYPTKKIVLYKNTDKEEEVLVSVERLSNQLLNDTGGWPTPESVAVDAQIFFYLDEETFNLPDTDIAEYIEDSIL